MIQKECITCGKFFEKKLTCSKKNWIKSKFCSKDCVRPTLKVLEILKKNQIKKGQHLSSSTQFGNKPPWNKGKKCLYSTGPNNNNWKGGITPENFKVRWSNEMKNFRNEIFKRDNYTCQSCGRHRTIGDRVILNLHHLKSFAVHKELRFDKNNAITLCLECHIKTDTYGVNTTT